LRLPNRYSAEDILQDAQPMRLAKDSSRSQNRDEWIIALIFAFTSETQITHKIYRQLTAHPLDCFSQANLQPHHSRRRIAAMRRWTHLAFFAWARF